MDEFKLHETIDLCKIINASTSGIFLKKKNILSQSDTKKNPSLNP